MDHFVTTVLQVPVSKPACGFHSIITFACEASHPQISAGLQSALYFAHVKRKFLGCFSPQVCIILFFSSTFFLLR